MASSSLKMRFKKNKNRGFSKGKAKKEKVSQAQTLMKNKGNKKTSQRFDVTIVGKKGILLKTAKLWLR